jgi:aspartyl/asparaginyl beta-hydroxylase (cupin superfamily)
MERADPIAGSAEASSSDVLGDADRELAAGRSENAQRLLEEAARAFPADPQIPWRIASIRRARGDLAGALRALDEALAREPYFFLALLSKGALIERLGTLRQAARIYRDALKIAPSESPQAPAVRAAVERARAVVAQNADALAARLGAETADLRAQFAGEDLARFDECLEITAGRRRAYVQAPALLHFPRLPAIPFYPRAHFPWLTELEAATDMIVDELGGLLKSEWERFEPYIQYPPGAPVNQWVALNYSRDWSTLHLWRDGRRLDDVCAKCPGTAALLAKLPMADQPGFAPTAMFSALQPRTQIPAHTGSTNTRLVVHLPLVLPSACRFRVGNETREWRMGEAWVFDDTIEHEAWNDSDRMRVILIFDVWNPLLSAAERALTRKLLTALAAYNSGQ